MAYAKPDRDDGETRSGSGTRHRRRVLAATACTRPGRDGRQAERPVGPRLGAGDGLRQGLRRAARRQLRRRPHQHVPPEPQGSLEVDRTAAHEGQQAGLDRRPLGHRLRQRRDRIRADHLALLRCRARGRDARAVRHDHRQHPVDERETGRRRRVRRRPSSRSVREAPRKAGSGSRGALSSGDRHRCEGAAAGPRSATPRSRCMDALAHILLSLLALLGAGAARAARAARRHDRQSAGRAVRDQRRRGPARVPVGAARRARGRALGRARLRRLVGDRAAAPREPRDPGRSRLRLEGARRRHGALRRARA